jgi:hypothetical protein
MPSCVLFPRLTINTADILHTTQDASNVVQWQPILILKQLIDAL